jgi:hypothetical protein
MKFRTFICIKIARYKRDEVHGSTLAAHIFSDSLLFSPLEKVISKFHLAIRLEAVLTIRTLFSQSLPHHLLVPIPTTFQMHTDDNTTKQNYDIQDRYRNSDYSVNTYKWA